MAQYRRKKSVCPFPLFRCTELTCSHSWTQEQRLFSCDKRLSLQTEKTNKIVTGANGTKSLVLSKIRNVPRMLNGVEARIDVIVLPNVPFHMVIGSPTVKRLGGDVYFREEVVRSDNRGQKTVLLMIMEYMKQRDISLGTDSEDFTSDSDAMSSSTESVEIENMNDLVLTIHDSRSVSHSHDNRADMCENPQNKLAHLPGEAVKEITAIFLQSGVIAQSLHELGPSSVPFFHSDELMDETPVYHRSRRIAPEHNAVLRQEIHVMLKAGIITPSALQWSFPVVIVTKKDRKARFCVYYRVLYRRMIADSLLLSNVQESFEELTSRVFFTTLDFFLENWQIRMSDSCKEKATFVCQLGSF